MRNRSSPFPRMGSRMLLLFLEFYAHARIMIVSLGERELHALFSEGVYKPLVAFNLNFLGRCEEKVLEGAYHFEEFELLFLM